MYLSVLRYNYVFLCDVVMEFWAYIKGTEYKCSHFTVAESLLEPYNYVLSFYTEIILQKMKADIALLILFYTSLVTAACEL